MIFKKKKEQKEKIKRKKKKEKTKNTQERTIPGLSHRCTSTRATATAAWGRRTWGILRARSLTFVCAVFAEVLHRFAESVVFFPVNLPKREIP